MDITNKTAFDTFKNKIIVAMENRFGDRYLVQVKEVNKNNGIIMHGLTILKKGEKVCPTIYLESFFDRYEKGATLTEIVDELIGIFGESDSMKPGDLDFFIDYEKVKNRLAIKLINREYNEELLEDIPHKVFLDLAIVCMVEVDMYGGNTGSVLVHNNHICMWGVQEEQILKDAMLSSFEKDNVQIIEMEKLIKDIYEKVSDKEDEDIEKYVDSSSGMYVVSNEKQLFGAATIVYPQVRARIADIMGGDYIILPSSIHELIVIPSQIGGRVDDLNNMINEVNATMVRRDEILSDHAYLYKSATDEFVLMTKDTRENELQYWE